MATKAPFSSKHIRLFYRRLGKKFGYKAIFKGATAHTHFEKDGIPILVGCDELRDNTIHVSLYIRTTSWDFEGERTDLHDALSVLVCCILRMFGGRISCRLWDVLNPAVPVPKTEVYARYATLEQPVNSVFSFDADGFNQLSNVFKGLLLCELILPRMLGHTEQETGSKEPLSYDFQGEYISRWARMVASALNQSRTTKQIQYNLRRNPCWLYFRSLQPRISIIYSPRVAIGLRALFDPKVTSGWKSLRGTRGSFLLSGETKSFVATATQRRATRILRALRDNVQHQDVKYIPLENYCVAVGSGHILIIRSDCGREAFEKERDGLRDRHQQESALLFPPSRIVWKPNIDDAEFEALIHELLVCEPGVLWVRKMGHTNEPDGGRDFIAEWDTRPVPEQMLMEGQPPVVRRRVVVQTKALKRAVGKADVRDIHDLLKRYDASGFFLATSSYATRGLIEHLEKLRYKDGYWSDWWTKAEVEERLIKNESIAFKYRSVVTIHR